MYCVTIEAVLEDHGHTRIKKQLASMLHNLELLKSDIYDMRIIYITKSDFVLRKVIHKTPCVFFFPVKDLRDP